MSIIRQDYGVLGTDTQTQQLIAPVLTKMKADRDFSIGQQFIVDSVLYKITAASVASGTDLVVDTNCEISDSISRQLRYDMRYVLSSSTNKNFTIASNSRLLLYSFGSTGVGVTGMWMINVTSNGSVSVFEIKVEVPTGGTKISFNTGTANTLKITNSSGANAVIFAIIFQGSITAPSS